MENLQYRHDMSDRLWALLAPLLPGQEGQWGGIAEDNRRFLNGVFWEMRTGAPWRDLPPKYGKWNTVYQRFRRWRDKGVWEKLLEVLIDEPDFDWLMIGTGQVKIRPHAAGAKGWDHDMPRAKEGLPPRYIWPWMQMLCRSEYLLQQIPRRIAAELLR